MQKQRPQDFAQLVLSVILAISSLTSWIHIGVISVAGTATWWGYVTLAASLLLAFDAVTKLWPGSFDLQISQYSRIASIVGTSAAILILAYVGIRLTDASRQFNETMGSANSASSDSSLSDLGEEFQQSLDEFADSLKDLFKPSLAAGWYMSAVSSVGGLVLTVKKRDIGDELPPPPTSLFE